MNFAGYSYEPYRVPSRIVTLMLLIAALNLYASYTANIVALLQSTTDSIKTPADLLHSPLKLGAQDVVYSRHYFKGQNGSWMTVQEGVRRVRDELFAFHAERGAFYKIVQETYLEEEKCGIMEIDVLNMLYPLLVMQTRSPYLEIVKNAALVVSETGLQTREDSRLYTKKPECHGRTSFVRIGLTECYFALVAVGYGVLLSLVVLAAEFLWCRIEGSIDRRLTEDNAMARSEEETDPFEREVEVSEPSAIDSGNVCKRVKRSTVESVDSNFCMRSSVHSGRSSTHLAGLPAKRVNEGITVSGGTTAPSSM
ncbi:unnamed protein product [Heterotrigona itama]|uniref:Ionotropic glutamate receptor C-terminal domain-containing protein n=1 Tax=Heterotrigona itama TaxID=395501 RepID=A0A6V7HB70_9HYME|nr:unnamed protein product [Heterotrigona itama]